MEDTMTTDYTQFKVNNYVLKITGVFNHDSEFLKKALISGYKNLEYTQRQLDFNKDYFYPDFRKQFFSNDRKRHPILVNENAENSIVKLSKKDKKLELKILDSRLDLFEDGFALFTINLKIQSSKISVTQFSDAAFLVRNFETEIEHTNCNHWHQYIESEILLGTTTRGESIGVDDYSGSKYKLFIVLDVPQVDDNKTISNILFDVGTLARVGSAIATTYDSMDKNYTEQLIKNNSISIYNNWKGLALLDTFTVVGKDVLDKDYKLETFGSVYHSIYLYCLFVKYNLFKFNYEIADLDEDRRSQFQGFITKYYYNYISYNFLPTEIINKINNALDIEKELKIINDKIDLVGKQIQEEQQERTNKILGIVTVLSSLSSAQAVYGYLLFGQKWLGWNFALYWTVAVTVALVISGGVGFYIFGNEIIKWFKKRK
jgi:hypothetical protein